MVAGTGLVGSTPAEEAAVAGLVERVGSLQGALSHVIRAVLGRREEVRKVEWSLFSLRFLGPFMDEMEEGLSLGAWLVGRSVSPPSHPRPRPER